MFVARHLSPRLSALLPLLACAGGVASLPAVVKPSPLFGPHAVLQRDVALPVWGEAAPGEAVTVSYGNQTRHATADATGHWSVTLAPLPAGRRGTLVIEGENRLEFADVVTGDVWLCSGQSNMAWRVDGVADAAAEIAAATTPEIRQFRVAERPSPTPADDAALAGSAWLPASPRSVGEFTAVGYFFAREMQRELGVPIGLLHCAWGGTPIAPWVPPDSLRRFSGHERLLANKRAELDAWPARLARIEEDTRAWAAAVAANQPNPPPKPWNPGPPDSGQYMPGQLFLGMVHPLTRYPLRGALWYQGESDAGGGPAGARAYTELQSLLIAGWREAWGLPDLPFLFVQLPNWANPDDGSAASWAWFREGQADALAATRHTALAITLDLGDPHDIHPTRKKEVGRRLALLALADVFGRPLVARGPIPISAETINHSLHIRFADADLTLRPLPAPDAPSGFELAGADGIFTPAEARFEGDALVLSSTDSPNPLTARYAWRNDPPVRLFNSAGLPAAPFRTDHLPLAP